jgi:hypothetical protein
MSTVEVVRHRVAIAGYVTDAVTGRAMAGVEVAMTGMPAAFRSRLGYRNLQFGSRWDAMVERPDRTCTRTDGLFYFLDLSDGEYGLRATAIAYGKRYGIVEQSVAVSRNKLGTFKLDWVALALPSTAVKGTITSRKVNVNMAEVRVKGSGERVFSDGQGKYLLAAIEPGKRTLLVYAQGYRPASQPVSIASPGDSETLNFGLVRDTG